MLTDEGYGYLPITEVDPATLGTFSCGKPRLDDFLSAQALALHKARLGFTNVVFHQQFEGPVGYFTLANDAIKLVSSLAERLRGLVEQFKNAESSCR